MNRSDRMKSLANAPRAKYSGSFLPTFFNHDSMIALGVEPERVVAEYFSDDATYTAVLHRLANAQLQRVNPSYSLQVKGKFKLRSNLTDRVPATWPPHPVMRRYLHVRPEFKYEETKVDDCNTFQEQLTLLAKCRGWNEVHLQNGRVDQNFMLGLQNMFHMHYFGMSLVEVRNVPMRMPVFMCEIWYTYI